MLNKTGLLSEIAHLFNPWTSSARNTKSRRNAARKISGVQTLEVRELLTVTLNQITAPDMPAGKTLYVPLTGTDSTNADVSYAVTSSDSNVTASIVSGGRSIKMTVTGKDTQGNTFTGDLTFRLFEDLSPVTTARIISLVNSGFYNNLTFHRIIDNFVAQGGDPAGNGTGGTGTKFDDEFSTNLTFNSEGLLAMANSGDDTNDSQFFVTDTDLTLAQMSQSLNFDYSIFGILTSGFDTFQKVITTPVTGSAPNNPVKITSATVFTDTQNGVLKLSTPSDFTGTSTITVTATGAGNATDTKSLNLNVVADTVNDKAFLGPLQNLTTQINTPKTFTVNGFDMEKDALTFIVSDPSTFSASTDTGSTPANVSVNIQVTPANGATPAFATVTLTPNTGFTGTINMIMGVRDATNRSSGALNTKANYDTQKFSLTVVNSAPTANAGGPYAIKSGDNLTLNASASSDPQNDALSYTWDVNGDGTFGDATGVNPTLTASQLTALGITDTATTYHVSVKADDGNGNVTTSTAVNLTLSATAQAPTASAGGPYTIKSGDGLALNASGSTDPQGNTLTYSWDVNGDGTFGDATGVSPTLTSAQLTTLGITDTATTYHVSVKADDGKGNVVTSAAANLNVSAAAQAPTANAGGPYSVVKGNSLTLNGSASTDPQGGTLTYSWDVNGDGTFGDATGVNPTLTAAQLTTLGITSTTTTYHVSVKVDDGQGNVVTSAATNLTLTAPAPTLAITGPDAGVTEQPLTFTLTATSSDSTVQSGNFTYKIDWNNDGTVDETVTGTSTKTITHTFDTAGAVTFSVTATDKNGQASTAVTHDVTVTGVDNTDGNLTIGGTSDSDAILIYKDHKTGKIQVAMNGAIVGEYDVTGTITVYGGAGGDLIHVHQGVRNNTILYGGDGNDTLIGSRGQDTIFGEAGDDKIRGREKGDILVGGDGNDTLIGNLGRDVMIGGAGADKLRGGLRGDLMIGGSTDYDTDLTSLQAIQTTWLSHDSIDNRIAALKSGVGSNNDVKLTADTVTDDGAIDKFFGYYGHDWFIDGASDKIMDPTVYDRFGIAGSKKGSRTSTTTS